MKTKGASNDGAVLIKARTCSSVVVTPAPRQRPDFLGHPTQVLLYRRMRHRRPDFLRRVIRPRSSKVTGGGGGAFFPALTLIEKMQREE